MAGSKNTCPQNGLPARQPEALIKQIQAETSRQQEAKPWAPLPATPTANLRPPRQDARRHLASGQSFKTAKTLFFSK